MTNEPETRLASKFRDYAQRMRSRVEGRIDDVPFVDELAKGAQKRVERHRTLRRDLAPLSRFVRSYARGSWRDCSAGDAAWALAAVMYVQSPMDAIPDYLPGGLRDDEAVVRWVSARIAEALQRYAEWEKTFGTSDMAIVSEGESQQFSLEVQVLDEVDPTLFARVDGPRASSGIPMIAANPALTGGVELMNALRSGGVVRVVGPQHLLAGLDRGSLELVHSVGGNLGTVRDATSKQIAGHLRFGDIQSANPVAPALAGFQLASALTLQYYLARIDRQLGLILDEVLGGRQDLRDERFGRIDTARRRCATVEKVLADTGDAGTQDRQRLELALNDLEQTYGALRSSVEAFCVQVEQLDLDTCRKAELEKLLEKAVGTPLADGQLLLFAAVVRHRIHGLDAYLLSPDGERRVLIATEEMGRERQEMDALLLRARAAFAKLNVPKRHLDERWGVLGGPEKELRRFVEAATPFSSALNERGLLPAYLPDTPFVADLRLGENGAVEAEWAWLTQAGE